MGPVAAERAKVGGPGITLLAGVLVATPLLQWAYVSALSHFTILEPPLTGSRGLPLALQVFFAPGNILAVALGVGLMLRSEWTRRIARVVFLLALGYLAWVVGAQVATSRYDSNLLLALVSLVLFAVCLWYFGRATVRDAFRPRVDKPSAAVRPMAARRSKEAMAPVAHSRATTLAACVEIALGVMAATLVVYLHTVFTTQPLLDVGPGIGVSEADDLLRMVGFVALALFLAPHALTTVASFGILGGRDMTAMARRYAIIACWTAIGCVLVTAWLATHEHLAFDARATKLLYGFAGASLAWHAVFLWVLARMRSTR